jgi:hypothetical protein
MVPHKTHELTARHELYMAGVELGAALREEPRVLFNARWRVKMLHAELGLVSLADELRQGGRAGLP